MAQDWTDRKLGEGYRDRQTLERIQAALSGKEWNSDTLGEIAAILVQAGFKLEEPR